MKALFLLVVAGLLLSSSVMAMTLVLGNASLELKEQRIKEINGVVQVMRGEAKPIEDGRVKEWAIFYAIRQAQKSGGSPSDYLVGGGSTSTREALREVTR